MLRDWFKKVKKAESIYENTCEVCCGSLATFHSLGVRRCYFCHKDFRIKDGVEIKYQRW